MVANHSLKQEARKLMELSPGLSLTDAKLIVGATRFASEALRGYSDRDRQVISMAARLVDSGRDLVVFGNTASGKTTALRSILSASSLRSVLLAENAFEASLELEGAVVLNAQLWYQHAGELNRLGVELLSCDELYRTSDSSLVAALQSAPVRALVIHAPSPGAALDRLRLTAPELSLKNPIFVEAVYSESIPTGRLLRLHTVVDEWRSFELDEILSADGFNPDRPSVRIGGDWNSPDNPLLAGRLDLIERMELWTDRDGFRTVLGATTSADEMLTLLRSARDTMAKRYEGLQNSEEEDSSPLVVTAYESSRSTTDRAQQMPEGYIPELQAEVIAAVRRIAALGRSVRVGITMKPSTTPNPLEQAAEALRRGQDLVVFGTAGSGKTRTLIDALETAALPRTVLIQMVPEHTLEGSAIGIVWGRDGVRKFAREQIGTFDLLGYDEVRSSEPEITELLRRTRQAAVTIHANSPKAAVEKLGWMDIELRNPVFLHCMRGRNGMILSYSDRAY